MDEPTTSSPSPTPWTGWPVGSRVVVRRRDGDGYRDLLGELVATGPEGVRVRTRHGEESVPADAIAVGKLVPPPPPRRPPRR